MLPGLCCAVPTQAAVTFRLKSDTGVPLANLTADGSLSLFGLYTEANDIPAQRQALADLYKATAGQNWTAAVYQNTVFLDAAAALVQYTTFATGKQLHCLANSLQQ